MSDLKNHRLKTKSLREHRSLAALDTSNPDFKASPMRLNKIYRNNSITNVANKSKKTFNIPVKQKRKK